MVRVYCADLASNSGDSSLAIWVPAIIAIISVIFNIIFTIFISPKVMERYNQKSTMFQVCTQFMDYLSEVVSFDSFDGVPTHIRKYSLKIHMMFKTGTAPDILSSKLEEIYQKVKARKQIIDENDIDTWNKEFQVSVRELRKGLSKYIGVF